MAIAVTNPAVTPAAPLEADVILPFASTATVEFVYVAAVTPELAKVNAPPDSIVQ